MTGFGKFFTHKIPFQINPLKIRKAIEAEVLRPLTFLKPLARRLHPIQRASVVSFILEGRR